MVPRIPSSRSRFFRQNFEWIRVIRGQSSESRWDLFEFHQPSVGHPLGDEYAPILIESCIMRANEFPGSEMVARFRPEGSHFCFVRPPVAEVGQRLIVFVDERHARVEIRNHGELALLIKMPG